jgi:hypothetical protein
MMSRNSASCMNSGSPSSCSQECCTRSWPAKQVGEAVMLWTYVQEVLGSIKLWLKFFVVYLGPVTKTSRLHLD